MATNGKGNKKAKPKKQIKKLGYCSVCKQILPKPGHKGWCPLGW